MSSDRLNRPILWILLVAAASIVAAGRGLVSQEPAIEANLDSQAQPCVLLQNGNVLFGEVTRQGEDYVVRREGGALYLRADQVDATCADLADAYQRRRRTVDPFDAASHLKLADWCLQQGLLKQAERELMAAKQLDSVNPRVKLVEGRLSVARQTAQQMTAAVDEGSNEHDQEGALPSRVAGEMTPLRARRHVGRSLFHEYPEDTMEQFRRRVQPLLLNSCTTSGCHSPDGENAFVLNRGALWRDAPRELTIENLAAVLDRIEREAPLSSRLLSAAATPHAASLDAPPIAVDSVAFARLKEWVLHVTEHDKPVERPSGEHDTISADLAADEWYDENEEVVISEAELDALFYGESAVQRRQQQPPTHGTRANSDGLPDPYDPEEFNQQFSQRGTRMP